MDFHSLPRKQLQSLCKKNKIPANITNVAMADALAALEQVEGLDEILNSIEADVGTPNVHCRTAGRATSQRKAARAEADGSTVKVSASARPLRGARGGAASGVMEQENKDANVPPVTPAVGRRRATAVSTRRKKEVEMVEEDGDKNDAPKTLAAASVGRRRTTSRSVCTTKIETPSGTSVQRTYSTRRSVRLLENGLSKMNLIDTDDTGFDKIDDDDVSQKLSNVSHQVGDSCDTEKGSSLQMDSTVVSENTQEFEVCSSEQTTEYECESHVSGSDVKLVSVTEINVVVEPQGLDEAEPEKINCLEPGAEPNASDEAGSEPLPDLEETCDSSELETENKDCVGAYQESFLVEASTDAFVEVTGLEIAEIEPDNVDNVSVDVTDQGVASSLMVTDCKIYDQVSNKGGDQDVNNGDLISLKEVVELMDEKISHEGDHEEDKKTEPEEDHEEDKGGDQDVNNGDLISLKEVVELMDEKISHEGDHEEDKKTEPEEDDESNDLSLLQGSSDSCDKSDDQGSEVLPVREGIIVDIIPSKTSEYALVGVTVSDAPTDINESVEYNTGDVIQDMKDESEHLNLTCGNMADEDYQYPITFDEKDAKESDSMIGSEGVHELESISNSAGELQEEELKEAKPEQMEAGRHNASELTEAQAEDSEEPVAGQVLVESASGPLEGELSCKSNVPIDGEVVSQEVTAITDQDTVIASENVSSDLPVQSVVSNSFKENMTSDDLHKKTMGELKRMLKSLNLGDEKSNCNKTISKEVDKKRTALQVLPQNRMTSGEAQIDD